MSNSRQTRTSLTRASLDRIIHHAGAVCASIVRINVGAAKVLNTARLAADGRATLDDVRGAFQVLDAAMASAVGAVGEIDGHLKVLADLHRPEPVTVQGVRVVRGVVGVC